MEKNYYRYNKTYYHLSVNCNQKTLKFVFDFPSFLLNFQFSVAFFGLNLL